MAVSADSILGALLALWGIALLLFCKQFARVHARWYQSTTGKRPDEALFLIGPLVGGLFFTVLGTAIALGAITLSSRGTARPPSNNGMHPTANGETFIR